MVGSGGLTGAYGAGVVVTLARELGPEYFDAIYASSVGTFAASFFTAGQPGVIEHVWRHLVDGRKLVSALKPLSGKRILDLDYLLRVFSEKEGARLDIKGIFQNKSRLVFVLTNYKTGEAIYHIPTATDILQCMKASSSFPFINPPVNIAGVPCIDGTLSDALPVERALQDGYQELVIVSNKPSGIYAGKYYWLARSICPLIIPKPLCQLVATYRERQENIRIPSTAKVIRPGKKLPLLHAGDTNKKRINETFDTGIRDADLFLNTLSR